MFRDSLEQGHDQQDGRKPIASKTGGSVCVILSDVDVTELRDPSALYTDTTDVIDPPELLHSV
jgi:hypothetical protein